MNKVYNIRNVVIGEGMPKVIVPIVGKTDEAILEKIRSLDLEQMDVIEWRVDFYERVFDTASVLSILKKIREGIKETPLIFTFRTQKEGGERAISMTDYTALNKAIAESGDADIVDVELFSGDDIVSMNIENIHRAGKLAIISNHDFFKTPPEDVLIDRMKRMMAFDADLPKIAVMPKTIEDVLVLLGATHKMKTYYADRPIITMSMSDKGVISRLTGTVFGSSMTFGAVGVVSAPGQIDVKALNAVLAIIESTKA